MKILKPYLYATLIVFGAFVLKLATPAKIISEIPFLLFFSSVVISGIYGGFRVGLYATLLSAILSYYFFLMPAHTFLKDDWHQLFKIGLYILDCVTMAALCGKLKDSQQKTEDLNGQLKGALSVRDEFLSIASHEMKTPLTSLKLQSQIFMRNILRGEPTTSEKTLHFAQQTNLSLGRLNRMIDDMLDISRLRSGNFSLIIETFDLCDLVRETVEGLTPQFILAKSPAPIIEDSEGTLGDWDRTRIGQVLTNLLTNALRYGENGQVRIRLLKTVDGVQVEISDEGPGISSAQLDRIFNRFERGTDQNSAGGLGLGLFISKQIIAAHSGTIWATSADGKGATFFFRLPSSPA